MLRLDVIHSDFPDKRWTELRFSPDLQVFELKEKLQRCTGTSPESMQVYAFDEKKDVEESIFLMENEKTLSDYQITQGMSLCVVDTDQQSLAKQLFSLEESLALPKFKISEDEYSKRSDSARVFLANLRRTKPELFHGQSNKEKTGNTVNGNYPPLSRDELNKILSVLKPGMRCELKNLGGVRGQICWIGQRKNLDGTWVGIRLDEPLGTCDGYDHGIKIFDCVEKYGYFLLIDSQWVSTIAVGDYPPISLFDLDEI